jgi:hypothetical protein
MYQNVYTPLQHLRRPPVHPGGLCWTVFARKADVLVWPLIHPETGKAVTSIQLIPGATWYDLKLVNKDKFFTEVMKVSDAGPYWDMQVSGYQGGATDTHILSSGIMAFEEFVVMFKDRYGSVRFIGSEDKGAKFNPDYNSGDSDSSRKISIQFIWQSPAPAPIYQGGTDQIINDTIVPPFQGQGDFNNDFNNDFNIF